MERGDETMCGNANPLPDDMPSPLAEQWPYLRFLGLGAWWAWIWLCYFSTRLVDWFPAEIRPQLVLEMYLASTLAIALTMLIAAILRRRFTDLVDKRAPVLVAGIAAGAATLTLAFSDYLGGAPIFMVSAVVTGAGTGAICLKVGRVYGTVGLSDSLTAGAVSLVVAALLYFVGLGIPAAWSVFYIAALPVLSVLLLCMRMHDPYGPGTPPEQSREQAKQVLLLYGKLVIAASGVAMTAGVGRGLSTKLQVSELYGFEGTVIVAVIGLLGIFLAWVVNRWAARRKGARIAYMTLMIGGVALILATGFGAPPSLLSIGKETLWLVFTCLMAFMAFRFGFPSIRAFALGQGAYFTASTAGWAVGAIISPLYDDIVVRMAVAAVMAFGVVLILTLLFTDRDIKAIMLAPVPTPHPCLAPSFMSQGAAFALCSTCVYNKGAEGAPASSGRRTEGTDADGAVASGDAAGTDAASGNPVHDVARIRRDELLAQRYTLSAREIEIMDLFAQGRSANWIAEALFISKNTVRSHLRAIYTKLDIHSRQELLDCLGDL